MTKSELTDAQYTANALGFFMVGTEREPTVVEYETAINAPQVITKKELKPFKSEGKDTN